MILNNGGHFELWLGLISAKDQIVCFIRRGRSYEIIAVSIRLHQLKLVYIHLADLILTCFYRWGWGGKKTT